MVRCLKVYKSSESDATSVLPFTEYQFVDAGETARAALEFLFELLLAISLVSY